MLNAEDRQGICDTLALQGHIFDGGHINRFEEVFTADVVYDMSDMGMGAFEGIETVRAGYVRLGVHNPLAHHLTNVVITDEEDDRASAQSKVLVLTADRKVDSVTQLDTLRRDSSGWRISHRVIKAQRPPSTD
ncbi:3-phenylpropionate/cinnamic acid dioxygenase small subunit [Streptomyces aurantiacus]|uniref:nuclear transport factor 2 family protein n=1 Tax=Streptomyces aurantiacus TaxID=47760 RepID=UPI00278D5E89|nr:nuclear transport factor 2 family protein [Streptomyces aurantiacus]MDQ0774212.1 3-phenylpropionate/cinnamic acid dioxygenase small subunit [Streptomyces aurantiacus]